MDTTDLKAAALHDSSTLDQGHAAPHPSDVHNGGAVMEFTIDHFKAINAMRHDRLIPYKPYSERAKQVCAELVEAGYATSDAGYHTSTWDGCRARDKFAEDFLARIKSEAI